MQFTHPWLSPGPRSRSKAAQGPDWLQPAVQKPASPFKMVNKGHARLGIFNGLPPLTTSRQTVVSVKSPATPVRMNNSARKRAELGRIRRRQYDERDAVRVAKRNKTGE